MRRFFQFSVTAMRLTTLILFLTLLPVLAHAQTTAPTPTSSGQPIPRFASLKFDKVNARAGPGQDYPINWVYQREGMPVEITAENGDWRKIRDIDGSGGWVHHIQLSGKRSVIVHASTPVNLTDSMEATSPTIAHADPGAIATLDKCKENACRVEADGVKGWLPRNILWGIEPNEEVR